MKKFNWNNNVTWKGLMKLDAICAGIGVLITAGFIFVPLLQGYRKRISETEKNIQNESSEEDEAE